MVEYACNMLYIGSEIYVNQLISVDKFKSDLDKFLAGVPDQPTCPGRQRAAATNSLIDQLQLIF